MGQSTMIPAVQQQQSSEPIRKKRTFDIAFLTGQSESSSEATNNNNNSNSNNQGSSGGGDSGENSSSSCSSFIDVISNHDSSKGRKKNKQFRSSKSKSRSPSPKIKTEFNNNNNNNNCKRPFPNPYNFLSIDPTSHPELIYPQPQLVSISPFPFLPTPPQSGVSGSRHPLFPSPYHHPHHQSYLSHGPSLGLSSGSTPSDLSIKSSGSAKSNTNVNPAASIVPTTLLPPSLTALTLPSAQNVCAKCNIGFRMTSDLVYHMRSHHKSGFDPMKKRREDKLKCNVCHESFRERHHLTRHMTAHQDRKEEEGED